MSFPIRRRFIAFGDYRHRGELNNEDSVLHPAPWGSRGGGHFILIVGGLVFLVLTLGVFWYQFYQIEDGVGPPKWNQLQWNYLFLILLCLPFDSLACGLRIWVVCRVLNSNVGFWTCLKAEWANVGVSMLTPSQSGGGFGQVYILGRGGASIGTALTISLISFLGSVVGLLCIGLYSLLDFGSCHTGPLLHGAVCAFTLISALIVLAAIWPGLFRAVVARISIGFWQLCGKDHQLQDWWPPGNSRSGRPQDRMGSLAVWLVNLVYTFRNDACRFLHLGKASFLWVCVLSLTFMFSRSLMAFLCLRFLGINTSTLGHVIEVQMTLILLMYFAPTPGGSGLTESASLSMMAGIVPVGFIPYYNLLWRSVTLYLHAIAGLLCLLLTIMQDARKVVCRRRYHKMSKRV